MDHTKVLKRAWHILWNYRALWLFGILLALTTTSPWQTSSYQFSGDETNPLIQITPSDDFTWDFGEEFGEEFEKNIEELNKLFEEVTPAEIRDTVITIVFLCFCFILFLVIVGIILRYVSETALIRMVDDYEESGERRGVRAGFRLGWSRAALRLFLIDLVFFIPVFIFLGALFMLTLAPLLLLGTRVVALGVIGVIATIGFFFLWIFLVIVVAVAVGLMKDFSWRVCALRNLGVIESIRHGYAMVRQNIRDVGVMWLIIAGINIGLAIVVFPIVLFLILIALLTGGAVGLAVGGLTGLFAETATQWIAGGLVGFGVFLLVIMVPMGFIGGLREVYVSSTWTLTYRELKALEELELEPAS
ncbi:MAG: hypothetical protein GTO18_22320 [Anaerolineales bacterium]|nr:hypothetical protein [Anaerolineales bacterium]